MSRRDRLLSILADHPAGLAAHVLLLTAGTLEERPRFLTALHRARVAGQVSTIGTGAGAIVRLTKDMLYCPAIERECHD